MTVEKKLQLGQAFVGYVVREGLEVSFEPANTNDLLAALHFAQNFTCRIPNILFNRPFFDELQQQQAYL